MPDNRTILVVLSFFDETNKKTRTTKKEILINEFIGMDSIVEDVKRAIDYIEQEN